MPDSKKRQPAGGDRDSTPASTPNPHSHPIDPETGAVDLDQLSLLQIFDLVMARSAAGFSNPSEHTYLRLRIAGMEEMNDQARSAIEKLDAAVEKLRSPALRVGTFLELLERDQALVCVGGTDYVCSVDASLASGSLQCGQRVLCNEAFAVVRALGFDRNGPVVRIDELLSDGRLRVEQGTGSVPFVVGRSALLMKEKLKPSMEVRLDPLQRIALEVVASARRVDRSLELVEEIPWSSIGGQEEAVQAIRDTIETPHLHRDLFKAFNHTIPKGFLLHGPPGCGKTLLGRAAAHNLRVQIRLQTGVDRPGFFLHVKGPEILNMWVGESERQVRDLFTQCRERAQEGAIAFLFIDEAESLLGIRHGGRFHNMSSTLVPMFCAEMDGLETLQNVVVVLASNRADLIDPAILRPGRIDRKIKVRRPDQAGARRIFEIYLAEGLPLAEPRESLAIAAAAKLFEQGPANQFLEVTFRSGRREFLSRGDLVSGAIICAIVERAKGFAIQRSIQHGSTSPLTWEDLMAGIEREFAENELFPSSDLTEDWLKLTDLDPDNVIRLGPVRSSKTPVRSSLIH